MWGECLPAEARRVAHVAFLFIRQGHAPDCAELVARSGLGRDVVDSSLACLVEAGQVNLDDAGAVVAVAGLSRVPARHELVLEGRPLFTWCAWDAIGIPAALALDAQIRSQCPYCGRTIELVLTGGHPVTDTPAVLWLPARSTGNPQLAWCPMANLFCSRTHLAQWRAVSREPSGEEVELAEAVRRGASHWGWFGTA